MTQELILKPIGVIHTPYTDKAAAPRQPGAAPCPTVGEIILLPHRNFEQALRDLEGFERVWILSWFHKNTTWSPRVLPPRSRTRKGLFATRSPHRPNPIGLSLCRLLKVEGRRISVENPDLLDGTPILDIKPYVPAVEAFPDSRAGWLDEEKAEAPALYHIEVESRACVQAEWLDTKHGIQLLKRASEVLTRDPRPHPYKRIKAEPGGTFVLAIKSWRVRFRVQEDRIVIIAIASGYSKEALAEARSTGTLLHDEEAHRAFHKKYP
jgi:tRNA (adenine37-N6)-methyltransferase